MRFKGVEEHWEKEVTECLRALIDAIKDEQDEESAIDSLLAAMEDQIYCAYVRGRTNGQHLVLKAVQEGQDGRRYAKDEFGRPLGTAGPKKEEP